MKPSTTAERLQEAMNIRGLKQVDVLRLAEPYCRAYGVKLTILGLALDVSEVWLMGYDVPMERKTAPIPMEEDERSKEFVELFNQLSTEQKKAVLYVMKGFLEKQ